MSSLVRCSLSLEQGLFDQLDRLVSKSGYENRSEFVRDLIREALVQEEWKEGDEALGTFTMVYDHHTRNLNRNLTEVQHKNHALFLASTHVHLDERFCAEMIMMRGNATEIIEVANSLTKQKGVLHTSLSMSSTGQNLSS